MPDEPLPLGTHPTWKDLFDSQFAEVRRAVEIAKDVPPPEAVPLREYIEAIFAEQRNAMKTAEEEREKAAKALRSEMVRTIEEGDKNLREHIEQQVLQIKAALESAEKLEITRLDAVASQIHAVANVAEQHVSQLRRERELVTGAQQEAIAKAEAATEKRFEAVNEFRGQLADQTATFMPREVAEAQIVELRRAMSELTEKMGKVV